MMEKLQRAVEAVCSVIKGKEKEIKFSFAALLAEGHVLLEDLPGTGKTTLALALAKVTGCSFCRIQFTNDLMPSDIIGTEVFVSKEASFVFKAGPIFHNIILADEINRATPRTQSALLEAMGEGKVSVAGETYPLPDPFFVIATQNPMELYGTFPLPESQLDRFLMRIEMGYPPRDLEEEIVAVNGTYEKAQELSPLLESSEIVKIQKVVTKVSIAKKVMDYIMDLAQATRENNEFRFGLSTRGVISLKRASQAWAWLHARDYVIPDDVKEVFLPISFHRLNPRGEYTREEKKEYLNEFLLRVPVPV